MSWDLGDIVPGEPLPAPLYLLLSDRYVKYKKKGDLIDRNTYDRMELKSVKIIHVDAADEAAMRAWVDACRRVKQQDLPVTGELAAARQEVHRKMMDIFHSTHTNQIVTKTLRTSEKLVTEMMKFPFAAAPLQQLQTFSRGTVDHSVNVSVLSVYLAMNMGYSHVLILRHLASGALLHDVGKGRIEVDEGDVSVVVEQKMKKHTEVAIDMFKDDEKISKEAKMIIAQHHECYDGSGYPKGLRGNEIYDLAKIVSIANVFDDLVASSSGSLEERQAHAIKELSGPLAPKFDPSKLGKALKILSLGI